MTALIKRLVVRGLHDQFDVDLQFENDISIFVGPNGIGKSTVLNILVSTLSAQWTKLAKLPFNTVTVIFPSAVEITVNRNDCIDMATSEISPRVIDMAQKLAEADVLDAFIDGRFLDESVTSKFTEVTSLQDRELRLFRANMLSHGPSLKSASNIWSVGRIIRSEFHGQIVYLPTYRRIEQDLFEVMSMTPNISRRMRAEIEESMAQSSSIQTELIRFGMEDIERIIKNYTESIKEYSRQQINSLSTSYLTAALKSRQTFDKAFFEGLSEKLIKAVLARVDDEQLNASQRKDLTELIKSLRDRSQGGRLTRSQEHISGYFPILAETHDRISQREKPLQILAEILNKYISPGKRAAYDPTRYEFTISTGQKLIPLSGLSSGEKQIISLFVILVLSNQKDLLVIIDEPELSLSVLWQEIFISDIYSVEACANILAVTHSPFIYNDKLVEFTKDMGDYTYGMKKNG